MDTCERCYTESDNLNDDLICQDCIEYQFDMMYERMRDEGYE